MQKMVRGKFTVFIRTRAITHYENDDARRKLPWCQIQKDSHNWCLPNNDDDKAKSKNGLINLAHAHTYDALLCSMAAFYRIPSGLSKAH